MMELKQKLLHKTFSAFIDVGTSSSETCSDRSLKYDMRGKKSFQSGKIHWRRNHQRVSSAVNVWLGGRSQSQDLGLGAAEQSLRGQLQCSDQSGPTRPDEEREVTLQDIGSRNTNYERLHFLASFLIGWLHFFVVRFQFFYFLFWQFLLRVSSPDRRPKPRTHAQLIVNIDQSAGSSRPMRPITAETE